MLSLKQAAESIGFETRARQVDWDFLIKHVKSPCIIHWNKNHFVIIYKIKKRSPTMAHFRRLLGRLGGSERTISTLPEMAKVYL